MANSNRLSQHSKACLQADLRWPSPSALLSFCQRMLRDADCPQGHDTQGHKRKGKQCLCLLVCFCCHTSPYVNWDYKHNLSLHESNYTNNFNHIPIPVVSPILLNRGKGDFQSSIWGKTSPLRGEKIKHWLAMKSCSLLELNVFLHRV